MTQTLKAARVDLVILDIMLPGEDGLTLCRRLRANGPLPIIMLTAVGSETDRVIGLEMGADDYLPKPFNTRELLARVRPCCADPPCPLWVQPPALAASSSSPVGISMCRAGGCIAGQSFD